MLSTESAAQLLKTFLETNTLAQDTGRHLKAGRQIQIEILKQDGTSEVGTFEHSDGKNVLRWEKPASPDISFVIPEAVATEIGQKSFQSVAEVGVLIFERMLSSDPLLKVKAKVNVGILSILTGGYLAILAAGGADCAKFLASRGLSNPGKIKDAISKLRG